MALKTFNIDERIYKEFSKYCKENGISMSKKIENFISDEIGKIRNSSSDGNSNQIPENKRFNSSEQEKQEENSKHLMEKYC